MPAAKLLLLAAAVAALVAAAAGQMGGGPPKVQPRTADLKYIRCQASTILHDSLHPFCCVSLLTAIVYMLRQWNVAPRHAVAQGIRKVPHIACANISTQSVPRAVYPNGRGAGQGQGGQGGRGPHALDLCA